MTLDEMERRMIIDSLQKYHSNMSIVAAKLGITRQTLYNKIKKLGIE
jgi:DNA-binding NtrC family response regulator